MPLKAISVFVFLLSTLTICHVAASYFSGSADDYTVRGMGNLTASQSQSQGLTLAFVACIGYVFALVIWKKDD